MNDFGWMWENYGFWRKQTIPLIIQIKQEYILRNWKQMWHIAGLRTDLYAYLQLNTFRMDLCLHSPSCSEHFTEDHDVIYNQYWVNNGFNMYSTVYLTIGTTELRYDCLIKRPAHVPLHWWTLDTPFIS